VFHSSIFSAHQFSIDSLSLGDHIVITASSISPCVAPSVPVLASPPVDCEEPHAIRDVAIIRARPEQSIFLFIFSPPNVKTCVEPVPYPLNKKRSPVLRHFILLMEPVPYLYIYKIHQHVIICQIFLLLLLFKYYTKKYSPFYVLCSHIWGVPIFYSCNSRGSPSGSKKNVIFLFVNSSVLIGSHSISSCFNCCTTASISSTLKARCLSPQASG